MWKCQRNNYSRLRGSILFVKSHTYAPHMKQIECFLFFSCQRSGALLIIISHLSFLNLYSSILISVFFFVIFISLRISVVLIVTRILSHLIYMLVGALQMQTKYRKVMRNIFEKQLLKDFFLVLNVLLVVPKYFWYWMIFERTNCHIHMSEWGHVSL